MSGVRMVNPICPAVSDGGLSGYESSVPYSSRDDGGYMVANPLFGVAVARAAPNRPDSGPRDSESSVTCSYSDGSVGHSDSENKLPERAGQPPSVPHRLTPFDEPWAI